MSRADDPTAELQAINADQQATTLVLRAALRTLAADPLRRGQLIAGIRGELERFRSETEDAAWQGAVAALVEVWLEDLIREGAPRPRPER